MIDVQFTWRWRWWARPLLFAWVAFARLGLVRCPRLGDVQRMIVVSVAALALFACTPPVAPSPDASDAQALSDALPDGGACVAVCDHLASLPSEHGEPAGCPEGHDPKCIAVCKQNQAQHLTTLPLSCWTSAPTKQIARACGDSQSGHLACQ